MSFHHSLYVQPDGSLSDIPSDVDDDCGYVHIDEVDEPVDEYAQYLAGQATRKAERIYYGS